MLSTSPDFALTHWYQVRYFFTEPFLVHIGTVVKGKIVFTANEKLSYDVEIYANVNGIERTNKLDLKNPNFRYISGSGVQIPATNYYDGTLTSNVIAQADTTTENQRPYDSTRKFFNFKSSQTLKMCLVSMSYENVNVQ